MSCLITSGVALGCRDNIGGIQKVYIGVYDGTSTFTLGTDNLITGFGATATYYTFEQEIETGSFAEPSEISNENGTVFYTQTLEITLYKIDASLRNKIGVLTQGAWRVLVLDQRGVYHLMGKQNPVRISSANTGVGKAYGDLNGSVLTFTVKEPALAWIVSATASNFPTLSA
jgi:hypothetical protein